ncbi:MCE family protein [Pseudonocardia halophobica]|uniref:Hypothetical MCE-family protein n=1 Tax=Pseudonocardia halophobica TaxID=29401 RepID=A0A9W6NUV4_9PSEU|nr:MCE family protein [Pseudonocardia halophobica]GLL09851.1 hypothetical MCE-family protein [Pseudonocardia halophobica]
MPRTVKVRVVGLVMVVVMAGLFGLAAAFYAQVFVIRVPVTLQVDRSGLVMDAGNTVTLRGVQVGTITDVEATDGGARLTLGLDPDEIDRIPANVLAKIEPSTIFGAKNVSLSLPDAPSATPLARGAVLDTRQVTVEVNTVFDNLATVLRTVDPAKLNATLGELAHALGGRGDRIAQLAGAADGYLGKLNDKLPVLQEDLRRLSPVTQTFADISPDVLRILDNTTVTGATLVDQADQLDAFLMDVSVLAGNAQTVLAENRENLATSLDLLRSPAALLHRYDPMLTCFIEGLDESRKVLEPAIGGDSPELRLNTTISIGQDPYTNPRDLPKINVDNGPGCYGLPQVDESERPIKRVPTDVQVDRENSNRVQLGRQSFAPLLTAPLGNAAREEQR